MPITYLNIAGVDIEMPSYDGEHPSKVVPEGETVDADTNPAPGLFDPMPESKPNGNPQSTASNVTQE